MFNDVWKVNLIRFTTWYYLSNEYWHIGNSKTEKERELHIFVQQSGPGSHFRQNP